MHTKIVYYFAKFASLLAISLTLLLVVLFFSFWVRAGDIIATSETVSRIEKFNAKIPMSKAETAISHALFYNPKPASALICSQFLKILQRDKYNLGPSHDLTRLIFAEREVLFTLRSRVVKMFVACRLETTFERNALLRAFLAQAYFGNSDIGINVASRSIFGKPENDLFEDEGYALAALLWNPHLRNSPDRWAEKQKQLRERAIQARM